MSPELSSANPEQANTAIRSVATGDVMPDSNRERRLRDYFAEMYVAGVLADAGWDIFFPRRDKGFDMIVTRKAGSTSLVRPVQVKGKYATDAKGDTQLFGYSGDLTAFHDDMIVAMPFFTSSTHEAPCLIAWLPRAKFVPCSRGWRCHPASYVAGVPKPRQDYARYFGQAGLDLLCFQKSSAPGPNVS